MVKEIKSKIDYVKQGKRNRLNGGIFERKTRLDLEAKGWNVSKYQNNLDLDKNKSVPAKSNRFRLTSMGFPDFVCFKLQKDLCYEVQFVECKINGKLSKIEKTKARWYLENNFCSEFLIASKTKVKNKIVVKYTKFE